MSKNLLAGLFILLASGIATWLFLPAATAPALATPLPETSTIVSIGPIQVNLMLIVLLVAGGTPFAAVGMAVLVRWLSSIVPTDVAARAPAPVRKTAPAATPAVATEAASEQELPLRQKLVWLGLIVVAISVMVFLTLQVLPPGFTLF